MNKNKKSIYNSDGTLIRSESDEVRILSVKENEGVHFHFVLQNSDSKKLFAVQTKPEIKYFFKDKEVSLEELIKIFNDIEI